MKLALIMGGLLLTTVAGSAYWIDRLQDDIGTLKGNQIILETKIQSKVSPSIMRSKVAL